MVFQEGGNGQFWVNPQERVATKFINYDDLLLKYKTKSDLLDNLKIFLVDMSVLKGERVGELQDISHEILTSVTNIINKKRVKGWMGKPKGLLQVLWEHVFVDISKDVCTYHTLRG